MKVLMINSVCGIRSTGRICTDLAVEFNSQGHEVKIAYGREDVPKEFQDYAVRIGNDLSVKLQGVSTRVFDNHGFGSKKETAEFLKWADEFSPDLLWLHNLHGYYINVEMLFSWIKKRPQMEVRWTLHDCWAFTGHCSHFSMVKCEKWKEHCYGCVQKKDYPSSYLKDNSYNNFERKRKAFTGVKNMTLITPSKWLADLVGESFLKEYKTQVHYNTVDTSVFKPTYGKFKDNNKLIDKKIILGVSSVWNERKGFYDFIELSKKLDDDYIVVLVGLNDNQIKGLPNNILGIKRTNSPKELAEIYTASDIFVNLTYEDTYPTVNLEANACGIPVITYKTGGSVESVLPENVVEQGNIDSLIKRVKEIIG